ncbi:MAG: hypothetical protein H7201_19180 [Candidatus Saccharibacteria bacterium]|nr:hypothetical protein [Microbacteriaceae bacterium]
MSLTSIAVATAAWPALAQTKREAWRRKLDISEQCLESFEEQLAEVIQFVDLIFSGAVRADAVWDRAIKRWHES